ncbi:hypothetical protein Pint_26883 [Pistacia integerrima]|uniref:Uncharacterized protein n=1 Tax=Pistacia integerrima TaxID=434235 RepID=A0ACC0YQH9_9ROSI|nr:hypothetical protein Pint_26883 [Pistacia integerrima]
MLVNMGCKVFEISSLSEKESWKLFKNTAGDLTEKRELKSLPKDICQKCGCVPMTIFTVANALKNKRDLLQWKEALRQLKRSSPKNFTGDMSRAYVSIQLSYNYLRSDLKKTFLLCSLISHQGFILDLVIYAMGLDIFPDIFTIEEARSKVYALISELKDSSLLLNDQTNDSFSMHDFIREVALSLAKGEDHVFSVRNEMNWRWPSEDEQKICKKIFIRDSTITDLREKLECPELELFFMNTKVGDSHVEIPEDFFKGMRNVKVLDLTRMKFSCLRSSSIPLLTKLQTLRLDNSVVDDIAVIGQLRTLKILSLQIGQLTQLMLLDLSNCQRLTVIAPNVISNLHRLEELYMRGCFVLQKTGGLNIERRKAILDEMNGLSYLATLEIQFNDANIFPEGLFSKELLRYNISGSFDEDGTLRTLRLECNSINWSENFRCFKNVEFICIGKLQCIGNVLNELERESSSQPSSSQLKHLHLHNTPNLSCIFNSTNCRDGVVFCNLESLILLNLTELKNICSGHLTKESFCNLKIIDVKGCVKLENIFSFANASSLPQLQTMKVESCDNMKQIFAVERGENENNNEVIDQIKFYQLRSLTLNFLPHLTSFYSEVKKPSTLQERWQDELDTPILLSNKKVWFT